MYDVAGTALLQFTNTKILYLWEVIFMFELVSAKDEMRFRVKRSPRNGLYHIIRNMEIKDLKKELKMLNKRYKLISDHK